MTEDEMELAERCHTDSCDHVGIGEVWAEVVAALPEHHFWKMEHDTDDEPDWYASAWDTDGINPIAFGHGDSAIAALSALRDMLRSMPPKRVLAAPDPAATPCDCACHRPEPAHHCDLCETAHPAPAGRAEVERG